MFELANVAGSGSPWRRYPEDFGALKPKLFKWQNIIKHCQRRTITVIWLGYNWAIYRTGMKEINSTRKHSSIRMKPKWQMLNAEMGLKAQHITIKRTCLSNSQHCANNCVEDEDLAASFFIFHNWHHILGCRLCLVYMCCVYTVSWIPLEKHEWLTDATVAYALQGSFQFIRFPTVSCQSCATRRGLSSNPAAFSQVQNADPARCRISGPGSWWSITAHIGRDCFGKL